MSEPAQFSDLYRVRVNGLDVPVYPARVSRVPMCQRWPGYQRPLDQTELAAFCSWDMDGPVAVEVTPCWVDHVDSALIRPHSAQVIPEVAEGVIRFTVEEPRPLTLEVNGQHHTLHLFANPPEVDAPAPDDPGVLHFGPGVHEVGKLTPGSGQTIYLADGAVVHGVIEARGVHHLTIRGRGILDGSHFPRRTTWEPEPFGGIALYGCREVVIEGIILRDMNVYGITPVGCQDVTIRNVKEIGMWRYNTDGIHVKNSQHVLVEDCFVRTHDDCIVVNGYPEHRGFACGHLPVRDVVVRRCVVWNDWDVALRIGVVLTAPEIRDIRFEDCDIIHVTHRAIDIENNGPGTVEDVLYRDIRVEMDYPMLAPMLQKPEEVAYVDRSAGAYCPKLCVLAIRESMFTRGAYRPGRIRRIRFEDLQVLGKCQPASEFIGFDAEHRVEDVRFTRLSYGGQPVRDIREANFDIGPHVAAVTVA